MKRSPTRIVGVVLTATLAAIGGTALAYFSTSGVGSASASMADLAAPTISTATPAAGGTVALTWTAVTPPGSGSVTYSVTRDGGTPAGNCPTAAAPTTVTTCTDSGVEIGTHTYKVTARWRSWTEVSAPKSATVTVGPAHHFTIAAASTTPTAGAADNLTITAKDVANNTVTTYTGSHSLTFSGASSSPAGNAPTVVNSAGTVVAFGSATALNFTLGVASVASSKNGLMRLYAAGTPTISATDGSVSTSPNLAVTVSPAAASKFSLSAASTTPTAGVADNLTTTAQDTYGNTATAYTGSHNLVFSGASASPNGTAPTVVNSAGTVVAFGSATALTFTSGVASVASSKNGVMKLNRAGAASITATEGSILNPTPLAVTVSPAVAARLALTGTTISAGVLGSPCLFTCSVTGLGNSGTVKAKVAVTDSLGNTVSNLGSGHTVSVTANGGAITGGALTIESAGPAESSTQFTYTAPATGAFTNTITAAKSGGTVYTSATATASQ
jgi:hypothetical protein